MSERDPISVNDPSDDQPELGYEEWAVKRIERAVAEARANPDDFSTAAEVRAHFEKKFKENSR